MPLKKPTPRGKFLNSMIPNIRIHYIEIRECTERYISLIFRNIQAFLRGLVYLMGDLPVIKFWPLARIRISFTVSLPEIILLQEPNLIKSSLYKEVHARLTRGFTILNPAPFFIKNICLFIARTSGVPLPGTRKICVL